MLFMFIYAYHVLTRNNMFGPDGMPCVILWRLEALDCRVLVPPETWSEPTRNPPSVGFGLLIPSCCITKLPEVFSSHRGLDSNTATLEQCSQARGNMSQCIITCYNRLYHTIRYDTRPYHTIPYHTTLHYTIL